MHESLSALESVLLWAGVIMDYHPITDITRIMAIRIIVPITDTPASSVAAPSALIVIGTTMVGDDGSGLPGARVGSRAEPLKLHDERHKEDRNRDR